MSQAWQTLNTRLVRAERRVQRVTAEVEEIPPGMITVLLYGIAVHLGGFPTPRHPQSIWEADELFAAVDRVLSYPPVADRWKKHVERDEEWLRRFAIAAEKLCNHIGVADNAQLKSEDVLIAFVRMLDGICELERSWKMPPDRLGHRSFYWFGIYGEMDNWIRWAGFSPEAVCRKARGT